MLESGVYMISSTKATSLQSRSLTQTFAQNVAKEIGRLEILRGVLFSDSNPLLGCREGLRWLGSGFMCTICTQFDACWFEVKFEPAMDRNWRSTGTEDAQNEFSKFEEAKDRECANRIYAFVRGDESEEFSIWLRLEAGDCFKRLASAGVYERGVCSRWLSPDVDEDKNGSHASRKESNALQIRSREADSLLTSICLCTSVKKKKVTPNQWSAYQLGNHRALKKRRPSQGRKCLFC